MEGEKRISSQLGPVKLFVGCVPPEISLATLEEHLRKYAQVLQVSSFGSGKSKIKKKIGHCIVLVPSEPEADLLLQNNPYNILGRLLRVEQFHAGKQLNDTVNERNQRRFFLKNVHPDIQLEFISEEFREKYGEIENVHQILPKALAAKIKTAQSDSSQNDSSESMKSGHKYTKIVSIQFKSNTDAARFAEKSEVVIGETKAAVERYNYLAGRTNLSGRQVNRSISQPNFVPASTSLDKKQVSDKAGRSLPSDRRMRQWKKAQSMAYCGDFDIKPTTKRYYSSVELGTDGASSSSDRSTSNLRFNVVFPVLHVNRESR